MLFNSVAFATFFTVIFLLHWMLPHRWRWILLLAASGYFYVSWGVQLITWLMVTTLISYSCARAVEGTQDTRRKKRLMAAAVVSCLGLLFVFKYFNFFSTSLSSLLQLFGMPIGDLTLRLMMPVGVSFYVFKTVSYVIDVYRGTIPAEKHLGYYALFVSFFPQLIAGPIDRAQNLIRQFRAESHFDEHLAAYGLKLTAWGFFKKLVIADNLSIYVNRVFDNVYDYSGFSLLAAAVFFTIQIYCDFSGYTDIANGVSKMLGINAMRNFDSPYFSLSVQEFWRRWHISLSTWFRDYVYIPLGGSRVSKLRQYGNLMTTFLLSGLWHGANWTFVAWGGMHGLLLVIATMSRGWKKGLYHKIGLSESHPLVFWVRVATTFTLVALAWVFFRANQIGDALYIYGHMLDGIGAVKEYVAMGSKSLGMDKYELGLLSGPIIVLAFVDYIQLKRDAIDLLSNKPLAFRWTIYVFFVLYLILFSSKGVPADFIYAQF